MTWNKEELDFLSLNSGKTIEEMEKGFKEKGFNKTKIQIRNKINSLKSNKKSAKVQPKEIIKNNVDFIIQKLGEGLSLSSISKLLGIKTAPLLYFVQKDPNFKKKIQFTEYYSKQELNIVEAESTKSNKSIQSILADYGFERSILQISQMKLQLSIKTFSKNTNISNVIKENETNIIQMLESGKSIRWISYELGIDKAFLRRYLKETMKLDLSKYNGLKEYKDAKKKQKEQQKIQEEKDALLPPKIYGYIRVSSEGQTIENQRHELIPFAKSKGFTIDEWFEETISGAKDMNKREIGKLLEKLKKGDILFIAELSRLSRKSLDIMTTIDMFLTKGIKLYTKKENIELNNTFISNILIQFFSAFAQMERDLTIQRTKEGLNRRAAMGMKMGRTTSANFKCDVISSDCVQHEGTIREMLDKGVNYSEISKVIGVNRNSLISYLQNKEKGIAMVTKEERFIMVTQKRQEYGKSILAEHLPDFTFGDFAYLLANKSKFIEFKSIGFSYNDLVLILGVDKESLQRILM